MRGVLSVRLTMTNRQLKALETKDRIYQTALDLLEADGYENIRIEDICHKAGVSIGTFYNYFKSKNEILQLIYKKGDDYFENTVSDAIDGLKVEEAVTEFFRYYATYNINTGLTTLKQLYNPENEFFTKKRGMQHVLGRLIQQGQDEGLLTEEIPSYEIVCDLFVLARGIVYDYCLKDGQFDLVEKMESYIRRVLKTYLIV